MAKPTNTLEITIQHSSETEARELKTLSFTFKFYDRSISKIIFLSDMPREIYRNVIIRWKWNFHQQGPTSSQTHRTESLQFPVCRHCLILLLCNSSRNMAYSDRDGIFLYPLNLSCSNFHWKLETNFPSVWFHDPFTNRSPSSLANYESNRGHLNNTIYFCHELK